MVKRSLLGRAVTRRRIHDHTWSRGRRWTGKPMWMSFLDIYYIRHLPAEHVYILLYYTIIANYIANWHLFFGEFQLSGPFK